VIAWTVFGVFIVWKNRQIVPWRKRKYPMRRIVILSDNCCGSYRWVALLNAFFPNCEIEIRMVSNDEDDLESYPFGSLSENSPAIEFER
jgi:hypothetical protein